METLKFEPKYSAKKYIKDKFSEYSGETIFYTRRMLIENFEYVSNKSLYNGELSQEQIIHKFLGICTEGQCREVLNKTPYLHF